MRTQIYHEAALKPLHHCMVAFFGAVAEPWLGSGACCKVHFLASSLVFVLHTIHEIYSHVLGLQFVAFRSFLYASGTSESHGIFTYIENFKNRVATISSSYDFR